MSRHKGPGGRWVDDPETGKVGTRSGKRTGNVVRVGKSESDLSLGYAVRNLLPKATAPHVEPRREVVVSVGEWRAVFTTTGKGKPVQMTPWQRGDTPPEY